MARTPGLLVASAGEADTLRAKLLEGGPCPVCGAERHPWAHRVGSVFGDLTGEQAPRVTALEVIAD